ncbi:hypothetical protein Patl1_15307 [Pistacia atlantica]|uniref:Uncharacterized protein n=1 Tax=Pistacia atlantica TaxID=434234 RepID=A0ACC1B9L4_9ROSI|nr:hypothetical protein Patl1_15307 [Pistacia atlantica]
MVKDTRNLVDGIMAHFRLFKKWVKWLISWRHRLNKKFTPYFTFHFQNLVTHWLPSTNWLYGYTFGSF